MTNSPDQVQEELHAFGITDTSQLPVGQVIFHSPIGIAMIDWNGVFPTLNPAYCAIYGYSAEELIGRPFTCVFPAAQRQRIGAMHHAFVAEGRELKGEWEVVHRNGTKLSVLSESVSMTGRTAG